MLVSKVCVVLGSSLLSLSGMVIEPPAEDSRASQPPASQPAPATGSTRVVPAPTPGKPGEFANAGELLTALETADAGMKSLAADIIYDRFFELDDDRQTRKGTLLYRNATTNAEGNAVPRAFAIHFDWLQAGERLEKKPQWYVCDGQWLLESWPDEKRYKRRRLVAPGETFDPLKIGEGPLPIPIGQKKADILARYDAVLMDSADGLDDDKQKALAAGAWQLKLTPRTEFAESDEFREVRLWYRRDEGGRLLPRMARTNNRSGDISTVLLMNVKLEVDIPEGTLDTAPPAGFDGESEDFRRSVPSGQAAPSKAPEGASAPGTGPGVNPPKPAGE